LHASVAASLTSFDFRPVSVFAEFSASELQLHSPHHRASIEHHLRLSVPAQREKDVAQVEGIPRAHVRLASFLLLCRPADDRVLVLSFGLVKEFASPAELLRDPNSTFSSMVNETGEVNAALLRKIAFDAERGIRVDAKVLLGEEGLPSPSGSAPSGTIGQIGTAPAGEPSVSLSHIRWHEDDE
jgi:hypothetical protein